MKTFKLLMTLAVIILFFPLANADGGIWKPGPGPHNPELLEENSQQAAINYQDGLEKMVISVNVEDPEMKEAVWIFPVPSNPNDAAIDIVGRFPQLYGRNVMEEAERDLEDTFSNVRATQLYPLIFQSHTTYRAAGSAEMQATHKPAGKFGVTVHEHIEKKGMAAELISTSNGDNLYEYLSWKRLDVKPGSIPVLDEYVGKDYSFVVAWIESGNEFKQSNTEDYYSESRQVGLQIIFPTESGKIFYPLLPTSVYGSKAIPIDIYTLGHVTPEVYSDISTFTKTKYMVDNHVNIPEELEPFFGTRESSNLPYTKIEIRGAPSKYLTEDLWIKNRAPSSVSYAQGVSEYSLPLTIGMILLISFIAGSVAGSVIFFRDLKEKGKSWIKYGLLGLSNVFSIIGLIIATAFFKTKEAGKLKKKAKKEGMLVVSSDRRKIYFILLFTAVFMLLTYLFAHLMKLPLS